MGRTFVLWISIVRGLQKAELDQSDGLPLYERESRQTPLRILNRNLRLRLVGIDSSRAESSRDILRRTAEIRIITSGNPSIDRSCSPCLFD